MPSYPLSPGVLFTPMLLGALSLPCRAVEGPAADWPNPGNDQGGTRYSRLDQINRDNVKNLRVAWTYHTGDSSPGRTIECTPLAVDGVLYVTTVETKVVTLDAATGKELWKFDPYGPDYPPPGGKWIKAS